MATDDEAAVQLQQDLRDSIRTALATHRPLLHHLNADTSWFLQIPRPESAVRKTGRAYYNILIDPWLSGGQSDVASWFSQQFHATPSAVQSISALQELAREIEVLARELQPSGQSPIDGEGEETESLIDAVAVSHEFTDHCHKETLLEVHPDTPVFAIKEAAKLIQGWKHFRTVIQVESFGAGGNTDWRSTSIPPLPDWIGFSRLLQTDDVLNYHSALLIAFNNKHTKSTARLGDDTSVPNGHRSRHAAIQPNEDEEAAEALVYTPHGIHSGDLALIPSASPPIHTLAFLHGLHNVRVGTASGRTALQSNLGAHNGLKAQRMLNAKYWIGTHDEIKKGGGLVAWFLQRDEISLKDALRQEASNRARGEDGSLKNKELGEVLESFEGTNWVDLSNGESRVLV